MSGIDWVHPSWRDLVIEELARDEEARRRFLRVCGVPGAMLALSQLGGPTGERTLPLLVCDADWDALTDRVRELLAEVGDHDLARLLLAIAGAGLPDDVVAPAHGAEVAALAEYALGATRRAWEREGGARSLFALEAWYTLRSNVEVLVPGPARAVGATWDELRPSDRPTATRSVLARADEWLALAQLLARHDPPELAARGFPRADPMLGDLIGLVVQRAASDKGDLRPLLESILARIGEVAPWYGGIAPHVLAAPADPEEREWWVPEDLDAPPSAEPVERSMRGFTRRHVERVLSDL